MTSRRNRKAPHKTPKTPRKPKPQPNPVSVYEVVWSEYWLIPRNGHLTLVHEDELLGKTTITAKGNRRQGG